MRLSHADTATAERANDPLAQSKHALEQMLTSRGNPAAEIDRVLAGEPDFVFGHYLRAGLIVRAGADSGRSKLATSLNAIEASCQDPIDPARRHASAARAWLDGDEALAAERYAAILNDRPRDILALAVAHAIDFRRGERRMLRDRVAQVLPAWDPAAAGYASVLAMYAFGLEENGQYRQAEQTARRALDYDPRHPGAIHVLAHVMEMQGRAREGLEFLAATESAWMEARGIAVHLAWHRALFHLDADAPQSALAVYDTQIAKGRAPAMSELVDASALLWRLQLLNIRLGKRWQRLADLWQAQPLVGARPFHIAHAMMAFAAAGRTATVRNVFNMLPRIETSSGSALHQEDALMLPLCRALLAFASNDYAGCVDWLRPVRRIAHRCGGSLAQCDIIHLTLTEAAFRAQKANLARALVAERKAQKPASTANRLLEQRLE